MSMKKILFIILVSALWVVACKKPYAPPEIKVDTNFLVIDGSISCGNNAVTTITLSRTTRLGDSILFDPELNALLYIDQEQGGLFPLTEEGNGIYKTTQLNLEPDRNYRIKIKTADV